MYILIRFFREITGNNNLADFKDHLSQVVRSCQTEFFYCFYDCNCDYYARNPRLNVPRTIQFLTLTVPPAWGSSVRINKNRRPCYSVRRTSGRDRWKWVKFAKIPRRLRVQGSMPNFLRNSSLLARTCACAHLLRLQKFISGFDVFDKFLFSSFSSRLSTNKGSSITRKSKKKKQTWNFKEF